MSSVREFPARCQYLSDFRWRHSKMDMVRLQIYLPSQAYHPADPCRATTGEIRMARNSYMPPVSPRSRQASSVVYQKPDLLHPSCQSFRQRKQELGIRMALGACWADIVGLVLGRSGRLISVGIALGRDHRDRSADSVLVSGQTHHS